MSDRWWRLDESELPPTVNAWDGLYLALVDMQNRVLRVAGDDEGAELYRLLGDARREAERIAPAGWSVSDLRLLPVDRGGTP